MYPDIYEIVVGQLQGDFVGHALEEAHAHDGGGLDERELVGALRLQMAEQLVQWVLLVRSARALMLLLHRPERGARRRG